MEDFLSSIGIDLEGDYVSNNSYLITLSEAEWNRVFNILDKCDEIEFDEESSLLAYDSSIQQYENDDFIISLLGDLNSGDYRLIIKRR